MAKVCNLPLRTQVLLVLLLALVVAWICSEVQIKALETGLIEIGREKASGRDGYEAIATAEVIKEYGIAGKTTGTLEVYLKPSPYPELQDISPDEKGFLGYLKAMGALYICETYVYELGPEGWVKTSSGSDNSVEAQLLAREVFDTEAGTRLR